MHWSKSKNREKILKKISKGWSNLIPKEKNGKYKKCLICGKIKYWKRAYLLAKSCNYCSRRCSGIAKRGIIPENLKIAQSKSPIGKKNVNWYHAKKEKHWAWQESPSYRAVHGWLVKYYGKPIKCENPECIYPRKDKRGNIMLKPKAYQWANISRTYKRDRNDFKQLCSSCHKNYDLAYSRVNKVV